MHAALTACGNVCAWSEYGASVEASHARSTCVTNMTGNTSGELSQPGTSSLGTVRCVMKIGYSPTPFSV